MEILPDYLQGIALVLTCTAFVKIATVLSIARYGLGLYDFVFGGVIIIAAVVLALVVSESAINTLPPNRTLTEQVRHFDQFLKNNSDQNISARLAAFSKAEHGSEETGQTSSAVLVAGFIVSELKEAFRIGLMLLVPFVIIDLLVMNVLMLLGVTQISVALIALPLKLLLFIAVDGWLLISEKLLTGYNL